MAKKIRYRESRHDRSRRPLQPHERWVFEPIDAVLVAIIVAIVFWLQWLLSVLPN